MDKNKQKEIAVAFSNGNFELSYPYLADNITWIVVGENQFTGKQAVMANCEQTAVYFRSVTTNFQTLNVIAGANRVAVNGTAEFLRDHERIAFVSACDIYEFNEEDMLEKITSYCIPDKK